MPSALRSRLVVLLALPALLAVANLAVSPSHAQQSKKSTKSFSPRLPSGWGKIGITDEQKEKIYEVQRMYGPQIVELQAKLDELRQMQDTEMKALLTPEQRKQLEEEAANKSKSKKKTTTSEKSDKSEQ